MIANVAIANTNSEILSVPAGKTYASVAILLCNKGLTDETITVYAFPTGGSAGDASTILKSFVLPAYNTWVFDTKLILGESSKVVAIGTTGGLVVATPSYMEI
jgi:hypothetical protein